MVKVTRISTGGTLDIVFNVGGHPPILAEAGWSGVVTDDVAALLQGDAGLAAHFTFEPVESPAKGGSAPANKGKAGAKAAAVEEPAAPAGE